MSDVSDPSDASDVPSLVESHLLAEHTAIVDRVGDCADTVVAGWDGEGTTNREEVTGPLESTLRRAGVLDRLPAVLADAVDVAGYRLRARPVPAPPYVVVTSTGPVLRATLADGRLVVSLRVFSVERAETPEGGGRRRYVRGPRTPASVVDVAFR